MSDTTRLLDQEFTPEYAIDFYRNGKVSISGSLS